MSDHSTVKVQINSIDALNRFIGDDPVFKMQIKETIINSFAKQYLKSGEDEILKNVKNLIDTELTKNNYCGLLNKLGFGKFELSDTLKNLIKAEVEKEVIKFFRDEVQQIIENEFGPILMYAKDLAQHKCDEIVQTISEANIKLLVKRKIEQMLKDDEL